MSEFKYIDGRCDESRHQGAHIDGEAVVMHVATEGKEQYAELPAVFEGKGWYEEVKLDSRQIAISSSVSNSNCNRGIRSFAC